jgi:hypothetical protein
VRKEGLRALALELNQPTATMLMRLEADLSMIKPSDETPTQTTP